MFSSSSRSDRQLHRPDGTHTVFCWSCGQPISVTVHPVTRAICTVCQRLQEGLPPLPAEIQEQYRLNQHPVRDVSLVVLKREQELYHGYEQKFSLRSAGANLLRAVGFAKAPPVVEPVRSTALVDQKKRQPLFSNVQELGDMKDIDQTLTDHEKY